MKAILAIDAMGSLGKEGAKYGLPWPKNDRDMRWFRNHTKDKIVVMGRKTFITLDSKPLPERRNIVLTRSIKPIPGARVATFDEFDNDLAKREDTSDIWIIGGAEIYKRYIPMCDEVYLTVFNEIYKADKFFDMGLLDSFQMKSNVVIDDAQYRIYEKLRKSKMPLYE